MSEELPKGWVLASLEEVSSYIQRGKSPKYADFSELPVVNQRCVRWWGIDTEHLKFIDQRQWPELGTERFLQAGDILWNSTGTGTIGRACLYSPTDDCSQLVVDSHVTIVRSAREMSSRYVFYFVMSPEVQKKIIDMQTGSTNQVELPRTKICATIIPVAPPAEQERIVSKIDELFSSIDEGERALERVRKLVERYRQSVLKAAVTGELTREWREQHAGELESGEALLTRILEARRQAWEQSELAKMKAKGIRPVNDSWKKKYEAPSGPDLSNLPELPDGWAWSCLGQLFDVYGGSTPSRKRPEYWKGNIPWASSGEVAFCKINETRECISDAGYNNSSVKLHPAGTILLAMIGEGKTRGQAAILGIPACHNQNAASIRVSATPIPSEYIYHLLKLRYEQTRAVGQGGNQPALNGEIVKSITVPLPPLAELIQICEIIETQMASLTALEAVIAPQCKLIEAQRQTILYEAFRGQLVPQDPTDEPASVLLERIAAERAAAPKRVSTKQMRTKKAKAKA